VIFQLLQMRQTSPRGNERLAQAMQAGMIDALTGLPNRALFNDRLHHAAARGERRRDCTYAVLHLDVDRFKLINDSLGHLAGDQLLIALADRLAACLRPSDTLARVGDDEFTILLEEVEGDQQMIGVADRILEMLNSPFHVHADPGAPGAVHELFVTASIGIAIAGKPAPGAARDLLRDADTALCRAKALGKNRHQLFDADMHQRAVSLLQMETDLRRAVEGRQFELHYQPIVQMESGRITAFEALIRWRHPGRGLIMPADFIPVAEETGIICPIGKWVLNEACRQAAQWRRQFPEAGDIAVAVNLSARQFTQADLDQQIQAALGASGLPARCLILEITESVVMDNAQYAAGVLRRLKSLGVKMNIDDFGTGYSSLACLHQFPVDTMKIDRSFISRLDGRAESGEILRTIIALAHHLHLTVTAEGVETEAQFAQVRQLDCESIQGFLLSRPLPAAGATDLLAERACRLAPAPLRAAG
jgi:diguanylate cyclase (GGDEF)-like protein